MDKINKNNHKRLYFLFSILFITSLTLISSQDEMNVNQFEKSVDVLPPLLPEEIVSGISEKPKVELTLKNYNNKTLINDIHVLLEIIYPNGELIKTLNYVGENGVLALYLENGIYDITLKIDDIATNGKDFYYNFDLIVEDEDLKNDIFLLPVGSVSGVVFDSKGNLIKNAEVKAFCSADYGDTTIVKTDMYGVFNFEYLPVGECKIFAKYNDAVGSENIRIETGDLKELDIKLTKRLNQSFGFFYIIIVAFIIIVSFLLYIITSKKKLIKHHNVNETISTANTRTNDILKTLNQKEKRVVDFLLQHDNSSSQAKIRYDTKIPKTSLIRIFQSLESKKIISIDRIGKLKKINLTEWFLGKGL